MKGGAAGSQRSGCRAGDAPTVVDAPTTGHLVLALSPVVESAAEFLTGSPCPVPRAPRTCAVGRAVRSACLAGIAGRDIGAPSARRTASTAVAVRVLRTLALNTAWKHSKTDQA